MKILADYHTHTVYSHGKGTIEENVKVAISKGIKTLGISDHGYKNVAYGVKIDNFKRIEREPLIPVLWGGVQELTKIIEQMQKRIDILEEKISKFDGSNA